jgi:hypothetical protein
MSYFVPTLLLMTKQHAMRDTAYYRKDKINPPIELR